MSDAELVARCRDGDVEAFEALYRQHAPRLYNAGVADGGLIDDCEDLLQEIYLSGDVSIVDAACERIDGRSLSGNLAYEGALARNGRYELTAHSGSIRLTLPDSPGFSLSADTFSGTIRSDLPVTFEDRGPTRGRGRGRANRGLSRNSVRARFGDGGAELMVRSFSGDIVISKR